MTRMIKLRFIITIAMIILYIPYGVYITKQVFAEKSINSNFNRDLDKILSEIITLQTQINNFFDVDNEKILTNLENENFNIFNFITEIKEIQNLQVIQSIDGTDETETLKKHTDELLFEIDSYSSLFNIIEFIYNDSFGYHFIDNVTLNKINEGIKVQMNLHTYTNI